MLQIEIDVAQRRPAPLSAGLGHEPLAADGCVQHGCDHHVALILKHARRRQSVGIELVGVQHQVFFRLEERIGSDLVLRRYVKHIVA